MTRFPRHTRRSALGGLLVLGLAAAFGAPAIAGTSVITVDMWDKPDGTQGMTLSTDSVSAGKVTFRVTNVSKTDQEHEFLIAKTELAADELPFTQEGARVDESKLPGLQELGDLEPGDSGSLTLSLEPGKYLLFCNEEGHVKAGMVATLTVTS